MSDESDDPVLCQRCGDPLHREAHHTTREGSYCSLCQIDLAGQKIMKKMERKEAEQSRKKRIWFAIQVVILLAFFSIIALEFSR